MQFSLREVEQREDGLHIEDCVDVQRVAEESQPVQAIGKAFVDVMVQLRKSIYYVDGNIRADVTYICSRCLESFAARLESPLDIAVTKVESKADDEVAFVTSDEVSLNAYVEEALFLALPYNPICTESCQGLCPTCGQNWNVSRCACDNRVIDPRLAGLSDLLSLPESE